MTAPKPYTDEMIASLRRVFAEREAEGKWGDNVAHQMVADFLATLDARDAAHAEELRRLRTVIAALPRCVGEWIGGSGGGGHRTFAPCQRIATHEEPANGLYRYACDAHTPSIAREHNDESHLEELPYADAVRALADEACIRCPTCRCLIVPGSECQCCADVDAPDLFGGGEEHWL